MLRSSVESTTGYFASWASLEKRRLLTWGCARRSEEGINRAEIRTAITLRSKRDKIGVQRPAEGGDETQVVPR